MCRRQNIAAAGAVSLKTGSRCLKTICKTMCSWSLDGLVIWLSKVLATQVFRSPEFRSPEFRSPEFRSPEVTQIQMQWLVSAIPELLRKNERQRQKNHHEGLLAWHTKQGTTKRLSQISWKARTNTWDCPWPLHAHYSTCEGVRTHTPHVYTTPYTAFTQSIHMCACTHTHHICTQTFYTCTYTKIFFKNDACICIF